VRVARCGLTGTRTASIAIAANAIAEKNPYCGKHVMFGEILERLVIEATTASIKGNLE